MRLRMQTCYLGCDLGCTFKEPQWPTQCLIFYLFDYVSVAQRSAQLTIGGRPLTAAVTAAPGGGGAVLRVGLMRRSSLPEAVK